MVEDDPSILAMVVSILRGEDYPVVTARNGAEALVALDQAQPSLILLDMRVPRMDGWQFAAALRTRGIAVPIVVMTAAENARRWTEEIGDTWSSAFDFLVLLESVSKHRREAPTN